MFAEGPYGAMTEARRTRRKVLLIAAGIGVPAGRILFFDDLAANIAGARACGLQAVQVRLSDDVAVALTQLGI